MCSVKNQNVESHLSLSIDLRDLDKTNGLRGNVDALFHGHIRAALLICDADVTCVLFFCRFPSPCVHS